MRSRFQTRLTRALASGATLGLVALLAACAPLSASGAAQATATCPPTPSFLAIAGSVTAVSNGSVTV